MSPIPLGFVVNQEALKRPNVPSVKKGLNGEKIDRRFGLIFDSSLEL